MGQASSAEVQPKTASDNPASSHGAPNLPAISEVSFSSTSKRRQPEKQLPNKPTSSHGAPNLPSISEVSFSSTSQCGQPEEQLLPSEQTQTGETRQELSGAALEAFQCTLTSVHWKASNALPSIRSYPRALTEPIVPAREWRAPPSRRTSISSTRPSSRQSVRIEPQLSDVYIAVMGVTGVGKSTFVKRCVGETSTVRIGHGLQACTQDVSVHKCRSTHGRTVYLIDTPGFDDTERSDTDVLRELATWLTASYTKKIVLNGIIYMHRITDVRLGGSAKRNIHMFKELCGPDALKNVILAASMWESVDLATGQRRLDELKENDNFWGAMIKKGSQVVKYTDKRESAMALLETYAGTRSHRHPIVLSLQEQMVDRGQELHETTAGRAMAGEIERVRSQLARRVAELEKHLNQARESRNEGLQEALLAERREMGQRIRRLAHEKDALRVDVDRLRAEMIKRVQAEEERVKRRKRAQKVTQGNWFLHWLFNF